MNYVHETSKSSSIGKANESKETFRKDNF